MIGNDQAKALQECIGSGGVAVIPTDTVYGLACDAEAPAAVRRMYELKGRPEGKPAAVMFFSLGEAVGGLPELRRLERTAAAIEALLPGPVTVLVENPASRFPLAAAPYGGEPPAGALLGIRVPAWDEAHGCLGGVAGAVLQSSANLSGGPDPRALREVPESIVRQADLALDGGALPGVASTVVSLAGFERDGSWSVVREGAVAVAEVEAALTGVIRRC